MVLVIFEAFSHLFKYTHKYSIPSAAEVTQQQQHFRQFQVPNTQHTHGLYPPSYKEKVDDYNLVYYVTSKVSAGEGGSASIGVRPVF